MAYARFQAAFAWAAKVGWITKNPIRPGSVEVQRGGSRGRDYVLRPGEHAKMVAVVKPAVADLLNFLEGTGCRPGEAFNATVADYDAALGAIIYRHDAQPPAFVHKTARKTGKDRVIILPPDLVAMVERLCAKYPTGPLFRSRDGAKWTGNTLREQLRRMRLRIGLKGKMIPYSYRHTYATRFLLAGGSIKVLAELMGNSVHMIEKHYGHLDADRDALRRIATTFRQTQLRDADRSAEPPAATEKAPATASP
jgi:integrase